MQASHAVMLARQEQCQHRHTKGWTPAMILPRYLHELFAVESQLPPVGAKVLVDEIITECIVPCGYGRMCCEERICGDRLSCLVEAQSGGHQLPASFEIQKGRVPLVEVPRRG